MEETVVSIATTRGDDGRTNLANGGRVSKADLRVEAYGIVDELIAQMGLARSICDQPAAGALTRDLQRQLFGVCEALATPPNASTATLPVAADVAMLTEEIHRIERLDGIVLDWAIPGEHAAAAAFDVARTTCRRAERAVVRLVEGGHPVAPQVVPYLNRLSDLLWLIGRLVEHEAGAARRLRDEGSTGVNWSRAW